MGLIWLTVKSATRLPLTSWPWVGHAIAGGGRRGAAGKAIVTLVLIADDNVCRSEVDTLKRLDAPRELGLNLDRLPGIVQSLCEDFLMGAHFRGCMIAGVDNSALVSLMAGWRSPLRSPTGAKPTVKPWSWRALAANGAFIRREKGDGLFAAVPAFA